MGPPLLLMCQWYLIFYLLPSVTQTACMCERECVWAGLRRDWVGYDASALHHHSVTGIFVVFLCHIETVAAHTFRRHIVEQMGPIAGWVSLKCCMLVSARLGSPKSACGVQLLHIKVNTYLGHLWPSVTSQDRQRAQPRDFVTFSVCWVCWSISMPGYWSGFALWMTKAVTMLWLGGDLSGSQKPPPRPTLCLMMLPELIVSSSLSQDGSYGPPSHLFCWLKQSSVTHHQFSSLFILHYKLPKEKKGINMSETVSPVGTSISLPLKIF